MRKASTALAVAALAVAACATAREREPATAPAVAPPAPSGEATPSGAPATVRKEVRDTYHGVEVVDPYRWLEDVDGPETRAFVERQNAYARAFLDALPGRDAIRARIREILGARLVAYGSVHEVGGTTYAVKFQPPRQQPFLVALGSLESLDSERVVVDPNVLDPTGKTAIDWFYPSPDGKLLAVSLSSSGSEAGDVHVYDATTGKEVFEVVPRVNGGTAGGDLEWLPDSSGFLYTRYPRGDERPEADRAFYTQIWRHALGTPTEKDVYELGEDFPRIAEIVFLGGPGGRVLATVQNGDGGEFMHFLRARDGAWRQLTRYEDRVVQAVFGERDDLYLLSRKEAPRGKILRAPIAGFDLARAAVVVPEGKDTLESGFTDPYPLIAHGGRLYATYQLGGPSEIRTYDLDGKPLPAPRQLPVSSVGSLRPLSGGALLFADVSYVEPRGWYRYAPSRGETRKLAISTRTPVDLSGVQVLREMATSKDGTQVPVNILLPRGATPGTPIPFEVTGYGGYGISYGPSFQTLGSVLLDRGVGIAVVNLRGGGEYGEEWHRQGNLTRKQNVFDDFIAALEHLAARKYALRDRMAILGGSNGGLLMGAVLTQRPDLPRAVISLVGIYDMIRVETEPNGVFNTTEFGTVKDPEQFRALLAYSPYHRVVDGTAYPATLLLTGANDPRVAPWHSHKMAARLQEASRSGAPILERVELQAGHGIGSALDVQIEQYTDAFSFLLDRLGVGAAPAAAAASPPAPGAAR